VAGRREPAAGRLVPDGNPHGLLAQHVRNGCTARRLAQMLAELNVRDYDRLLGPAKRDPFSPLTGWCLVASRLRSGDKLSTMAHSDTEAFSRVKVDDLLRDVGWNLTDGRSVRFECVLSDCNGKRAAPLERKITALPTAGEACFERAHLACRSAKQGASAPGFRWDPGDLPRSNVRAAVVLQLEQG
jgi:hypothetical protein